MPATGIVMGRAVQAVVAFGAAMLCGLLPSRLRAQTCSVTSTSLAFGVYQPVGGTATMSTATVSVTCSVTLVALNVSYAIQLGTGGGGGFSSRTMTGTGSSLKYQIYTDPLYSQVWGDGTAGTSTVGESYGLQVLVPVTRTYPAYGRIAANQVVGTGAFTDTVMVLLSY